MLCMIRLLSPGVYIEEIGTQPLPIQSADTATAAFLGETKFGPDAPTQITSWHQFQSVFGGFFGLEKFFLFVRLKHLKNSQKHILHK